MAPKKQASPLRWIDLTEAQKKEVLRIRNMEQCRKNRKRWKETDEEMKALYDSNEKKIDELEKLVSKLSNELRGASSSSSSSKWYSSRPKYQIIDMLYIYIYILKSFYDQIQPDPALVKNFCANCYVCNLQTPSWVILSGDWSVMIALEGS